MTRGVRPYAREGSLVGYAPLVWDSDSTLSVEEQAHVDRERRSLWRHGIRKQPLLDRMAFEFGAVATMLAKGSKHDP